MTPSLETRRTGATLRSRKLPVISAPRKAKNPRTHHVGFDLRRPLRTLAARTPPETMHAVHVTSAAFPAGAVPSRRAGSRAAPRALGRVAAVRSASLNLARDDRDLRAGCAMTAPRAGSARARAPGPSTSSHRSRDARDRAPPSHPRRSNARERSAAPVPGPPTPRRPTAESAAISCFLPHRVGFHHGVSSRSPSRSRPGVKTDPAKALERFTAPARDKSSKARRSSPPPRPRRPAPSPLLSPFSSRTSPRFHLPPPSLPLLPSS